MKVADIIADLYMIFFFYVIFYFTSAQNNKQDIKMTKYVVFGKKKQNRGLETLMQYHVHETEEAVPNHMTWLPFATSTNCVSCLGVKTLLVMFDVMRKSFPELSRS